MGNAGICRWAAEFPLTTIIGLDLGSETFSFLYADARGVYRVYQMSLTEDAWKIWGETEDGYHQRFTGTFNDDGTTITGRWEGSRDATT